jgi:hypothetical protein
MRISKLFALIATIAVLVFAFAAAASAQPGSQGTVYGRANMQPTISIQVSGPGSDSGSPLVYNGHAGGNYGPDFGALVTVANTGDQNVPILLGYGSDPTDGIDTWNLSGAVGPTDCVWGFAGDVHWATVPSSGGAPEEVLQDLAPGASFDFDSVFSFPLDYNGNPHTMTALFIASDIN